MVYQWMRALGFRYEVRKKGFYVDAHEKPAMLQYRKKFISRYKNYKRRMQRWIQLTKKESKALEKQKLIPKKVVTGTKAMMVPTWLNTMSTA
jgi:hypothetical protein